MAIKGINTAPIKKDNRLHVMTFKIRDEHSQDRIIYMQLTTLVDFLIILRSRTVKLAQRLENNDEACKAELMAAAEALVANIPQVIESEVMQPDAGNLVMTFAPKMKEDGFSLIMSMQNEQVVMIDIEDAQVEFIIMAIRRAIEVIEDKESMNIIAALLDFILLYFADMSSMDNLNYREVAHEAWKQALFSDHYAVLYCFDTEQGKKILGGTMMKCSAQPGSEELDSVVKRISVLTPGLQALQQKNKICQTFMRKIPTEPGQILTKEFCLKTLHDFCLETQASLSA